MTTIITGGTGLVGQHLLPHVEAPLVFSRDAARAKKKLGEGVDTATWDVSAGPPPADALEGAEIVFNLAGEPVAEGRWTDEKKRRILDSRVEGTRNLIAGLAKLETPPKVLVSASAVGYYGDRGDTVLPESASVGQGFLAEVCNAWEDAAMTAEEHGMRVVCLRIGVVLAKDGGALDKMLPPFKLGVGGRLGDGKQYMPCIHIDDIIGLLLHARDDEGLRGPLNGVAPDSVTNAEFTKALGTALGRPTILPVPKTALKLALGGMADVLLASQRVVPKVAMNRGYTFKFPTLRSALADCVA